jgi:hypothetical protein
MTWPILLRWARPTLLLVLAAAVLSLGWLDAARARPGQHPAGQTIPSPSPLPTSPTATPAAGLVPVGPASDLQLSAAGGDCIAWVTPGDIAVDGALSLDPYPVADVPLPSPAYLYIRSCELELFDASGQPITPLPFAGLSDQQAAPLPFAGPVDVCFPYNNEELALAQANMAVFTVLRFDAAPGVWAELPLRLDPAGQTACGATIWPGIFALAIPVADPSNLPNTSGEILEATARAAPARAVEGPQPTGVASSPPASTPQPVATSTPRSAGGAVPEQPSSPAAADLPAGPATEPAPAPRSSLLIWVMAGIAVLMAIGLLIFRRRAAR